jgi:hypothetical protein
MAPRCGHCMSKHQYVKMSTAKGGFRTPDWAETQVTPTGAAQVGRFCLPVPGTADRAEAACPASAVSTPRPSRVAQGPEPVEGLGRTTWSQPGVDRPGYRRRRSSHLAGYYGSPKAIRPAGRVAPASEPRLPQRTADLTSRAGRGPGRAAAGPHSPGDSVGVCAVIAAVGTAAGSAVAAASVA